VTPFVALLLQLQVGAADPVAGGGGGGGGAVDVDLASAAASRSEGGGVDDDVKLGTEADGTVWQVGSRMS